MSRTRTLSLPGSSWYTGANFCGIRTGPSSRCSTPAVDGSQSCAEHVGREVRTCPFVEAIDGSTCGTPTAYDDALGRCSAHAPQRAPLPLSGYRPVGLDLR